MKRMKLYLKIPLKSFKQSSKIKPKRRRYYCVYGVNNNNNNNGALNTSKRYNQHSGKGNKTTNNAYNRISIVAATVASLIYIPWLHADDSTSKSRTYSNSDFNTLNNILLQMNYSKNSDKINSERTSKLGNKTNENIQNVVSSKNVSSTSSYHSKALPSLLDWDGDTIHVNTTFLIIGNDTSSSIAYHFINDNKSKNQTVTYENETDDHIVDLNVDLKIVMMASGKIIKYDQLLLANDDKTTEQLQNYAPIDQRALSLVCSLNSNDDISVDKVEVDKSKGNCIEADTENNVENGNEKNI